MMSQPKWEETEGSDVINTWVMSPIHGYGRLSMERKTVLIADLSGQLRPSQSLALPRASLAPSGEQSLVSCVRSLRAP